MSCRNAMGFLRCALGSGRGAALGLVVVTTLFAGGGVPRLAAAQDNASAIPEFTGARVSVSGVPDDFGPLREDIARLERSAPQTYYVAVVRSTGAGPKSTRPYLERMVEQWETEAGRRGIAFDKKRSVIVLVAIANRQVIVLGGEDLQEQLGFRDPYIERDLLRPHFLPYARTNDYVRGLRVLVAQIDRWIAEHDKELARHRADEAAREARLKSAAQSALESARRQLEETRKELGVRQAEGFAVGALDARMRKAQDDLDAAARRLDASAGEVLDLAQQARRELLGVVEELHRISARQTATDEALRKAAGLSGEVLKAIEQAGRDGLPIGPVQAELDVATAQIEQARQALKSNPENAETLAAGADRGLRAALDHARQLPDLHRRAEQEAKAVPALERSAKAELDRVRAAGATVTDFESDWKRASSSLAAARSSAGSDDRQALASFREAEATLIGLRDQARVRFGQHRFTTRTLPLRVLGVIAVGVLGLFGLFWLRKRHLQQKFDRRFKDFREQAVALMDRLDALRQRHKTLPSTDPDYTQPLAGATLACYSEVEKDLNGLWEHWLRVMAVWDQAQALVRAGSGLAVAKTEEASKLIEQEGNFEELLRQCGLCEGRLDQLNQAHEQAQAAIKAAHDEEAALRTTLDAIAAAGLPTDPYAKALTTVEGLLAQAEGLVQADPIGAGAATAHSREALGALAERTAQVLARFGDAQSALVAIDEVAAGAAELRSQGLKLTEDQADPDPRLQDARRRQAAAIDALRKDDPAAAAKRIDEARTLTGEARQGIDRHCQARDAARKELPAQRDRARRLGEAADRTVATLEELRQGFAPESWNDVANNLDQARALLRSIEEKLAGGDASDGEQNYLRAGAALAEVAHDQDSVDSLLRAVAERQGALTVLARQSRERIGGLEDEIRRTEVLFGANRHAIGPEALRSLDQTGQSYRDLKGVLNQRLPNWPEIRRRIDVVQQGAATALRQGQEDIEGFRRVSERLDEVRQKAQAVGGLLEQEEKDRPLANQRYSAAADALARFEEGDGAAAGWDRLLNRLVEIDGNLDRAEALAREDISLANAAIAAIAEAERAIRAARAFYELGFTADASQAEADLVRARGALATQAYERAIELANAAERAARNAHEAAAHDARLRGRQIERAAAQSSTNSAMVIAAAQAAAQASAGWPGSGSDGSAPAPSVPSSPDSGAAAASWGSGPGQGNWTAGADQAGW